MWYTNKGLALVCLYDADSELIIYFKWFAGYEKGLFSFQGYSFVNRLFFLITIKYKFCTI